MGKKTKSNKITISKNRRKNKRTRKNYHRGGNGDKVRCSICGKMVNKEDTFIPSDCLMAHGNKAAHRICSKCWWDPKKGFALENVSHKCPGCVKKLPLNASKKVSPTVIDLTND